MQRRQFPPHTSEEKLTAEKAKLEAQLADLKSGPQRDALLKKIRQLNTADNLSKWLESPGLQSPD